MGVRAQVGKTLDATLGKERTSQIRRFERRTREQLAKRLAPQLTQPAPSPAERKPPANARKLGEPNDTQGGWIPSDPFVEHPKPTLTRHDLLRRLHEVLTPRTYLEIGVNEGASLTLSRSRSVAIDPEFRVRNPLHCDLDLIRAKSDEYFTRPDALSHLEGVPVDLAFIDGMHLSEFAVRDFINVERRLSPVGVAVFDDILPRNPLEAARVRLTGAWAGDVYKAVEVIGRNRPDLVVMLINTWPTGTALVVGADPSSDVLQEAYESEVAYLQAPDPQQPPQSWMSRAAAVDPELLLTSEAWSLLVEARETSDRDLIDKAKAVLRAIPTLG